MVAFGKEYHLWMFDELVRAVFYLAIYQVLKSSSIMVCLKKILNGEMSSKKDTEKIVLLKVKGLIHIVKFRTIKIAYFFHPPPVILSGSTKYCHSIGRQVFCSNRGMNGKFIFPWRKMFFKCFSNSKGSFQLLDLVNDFWKKYYAMLWCTRFFIMVVHACTKSLSKQGIQKKLFTRISNSFSP